MRWVFITLVLINVCIFPGYSLYAGNARRAAFERSRSYADAHIEANRCTAQELAVRQIAWVDELNDAFVIARKTGHPIFVVNGDGDICTGRL